MKKCFKKYTKKYIFDIFKLTKNFNSKKYCHRARR